MRGVAAGRSAQRACERSSDWRRGAAGSPDPEKLTHDNYQQCAQGSPDPEKLTHDNYQQCAQGSPDPKERRHDKHLEVPQRMTRARISGVMNRLRMSVRASKTSSGTGGPHNLA